MNEIDRKLQEKLKTEADEMIFNQMDLSAKTKNNIRKMTAEGTAKRRSRFPRIWIAGSAALVAAVVIVAGYPMLQQSSPIPAPTQQTGVAEPPISGSPQTPVDGGAAGSGLSALITTTVGTPEEAKSAFGEELLVPITAPDSFKLQEITTTGMPDQPIRDVVFTFVADGKQVVFSATRMEPASPMEMFSKTTVRGQDGYVFEQPELAELFWSENGVHYSIVGNLSAAEAVQTAEAAQ